MEKINYKEPHFALLPEEIESAQEAGTLESLQAKIEAANGKVQAGQEPELVIEADPELVLLMEQREKMKEAERAHDEVEPVEALDLGSAIDRELAAEEPEDEQDLAQ